MFSEDLLNYLILYRNNSSINMCGCGGEGKCYPITAYTGALTFIQYFRPSPMGEKMREEGEFFPLYNNQVIQRFKDEFGH